MQHLMPVAPNVAGEPHHSVPAAPSRADTSTSPCAEALKCLHSSKACPALASLFARRSVNLGEEATQWLQRLKPCASCRLGFEAERAQLKGLRLGQRERNVLAGAAGSDAYAVTSPGMTRSESAARRRAAQSLVKAGLVAPTATGSARRATVSLTPLGSYVMAAYGRFILKGKPVRWDRPSSKVPLPGRQPEALLDEALDLSQAALRDTLLELNKVLFAAVLRPVRDPSTLEAVTRHLEVKAEGLRQLVGPAEMPQPVLVSG